jgi:acyl-CoA dehydrogenase
VRWRNRQETAVEFALSEAQTLLVETVRRFIRAELTPLEDAIEATGRLDPALAGVIFGKSRALGFYAMNMPAEFGGGGLSAVDTCLVEEQFGHTTDILIRRAFGCVYDVLLECQGEQKQLWLIPAVTGERTIALAITEPGAGSDTAGISTRAVRDGDGWLLTGQKCFISDGEFADAFVVSAVTDPAAKSRGISLFLVDKAMPGFAMGRNQPMMGLVGTSHSELFFDGVRLGREHLLGGENHGLRLILETLGRIRLALIGARSVGKAVRLLELMANQANERRQFGRPIGDFQLIQQMLADSAIEINAARLMLLRAAWEIDRGRDARQWISMVKVHASEMVGRVADRAVQVFGGMGYCKDLPIERLYRDARIFRIFDGTSEIHRIVVARAVRRDGTALFDVTG